TRAVAPGRRDAAPRRAILLLAFGRSARRRARLQGGLQLHRRPRWLRRGRRYLPAVERALQRGAARRFGDPRAACAQHRCVRREAKSPQRQMQFQVGATVPHHFEELAADRTRLWITTDAGVITIDPVAERWTTVYADSQPLGRATVVPCDSRIWLQRSDTVLLADPEGQRFEIRTLGPSETPPSRRNIQTRCASKGLWIYDTGRLVHVPLAAGTTSRYDVPPLGERASVNDFVDTHTGVYLLAYVPQASSRFAFARFDTATKSVTQIALPTGPGVYGFRVV